MKNKLRVIKHNFDIAINHLDLFYPFINIMYINSLENQNGSLFEEYIKEFVRHFNYYSMGKVSIDKTISDAKLFLKSEELERFYLYAKDSYKIKYEHLELLIKSVINRKPLENNQLRNIFFQNMTIGFYCFPQIYNDENNVFSLEIIEGIKTYFKDFESKIDEITILMNASSPQQIELETKTEKLNVVLGEYGFFELPMVKQISEPNKRALIKLMNTNGMPYSIAMFDHLGFLEHLKKEYFDTANKIEKIIAEWFNCDSRTAKGQIAVLKPYSKENRNRYTADKHIKTVQKDYDKLK